MPNWVAINLIEMMPMPDKFFLDSNIVIYALGDDLKKKARADDLLSQGPILSTQVLTEVSQVCLKKLKLAHDLVIQWVALLNAHTQVISISADMIQDAIKISQQYKYSFYDSLIISASAHSEAKILYSEDMQDGQEIEGLKIVNPFLS